MKIFELMTLTLRQRVMTSVSITSVLQEQRAKRVTKEQETSGMAHQGLIFPFSYTKEHIVEMAGF